MAELGVWAIPGYVVHERLEAGLVSASYLASRSSDGYPVLLQVISEEFADPASAAQFRATIERVATVRHPVVPTIRDVGEVDGLLYVITSAVEGQPLGLALARGGAVPLDDALAACTELADALDTLAAAGIVHGAISPTTVWRNDRDRSPSAPYVSLRGFGNLPLRTAAVRRHPDASPPADILYTAPEQVHGAPVGVRTDQYALACMTLQCLTGSPPFVRPTIAALFDAHAREDPGVALGRADWLPPRVADGLRRGLSKDPGDRFDSCTTLATALGGVSRRSWSWMLERRGDASAREIDIRDEIVGAGLAASAPTIGVGATAPADTSRTARSFSEVDWLPGSAVQTGHPRPVGASSSATSERRRGRRSNWRIAPTVWRRAALVVLASVLVVTAIGVVRALRAGERTTPATAAADQPTGGSAPEVAASWREQPSQRAATALDTAGEDIVGVAGTTILSADQATGKVRWSTTLATPVRELAVLGPTAIVRTATEFHAIDVSDGSRRWRSSETDMPVVEAFITGRGRMFGVGRDDAGRPVVHAIDPITGELGWTIAPLADGGGTAPPRGATGVPPLIAFDGSEQGQRSLYVTDRGRLHAFDVTTRSPRWQITLHDPRPTSMVALAGSVLVVGSNGEVCRYRAGDGGSTWTTCASMERTDVPATIAQVRDSRVIVKSTYEVLSIDYTRGTPSWRIVSTQPLQEAIAANRAATYVAGPDGTIEAIGQRNGATLWESAPFGQIGAMTATDDAVFVSTADGRLARLEAPDSGS